MDFVNKALAQITDLFRSMTPGARITSGLLLLVVVVGLGYLFNVRSSSPDAYLMNGEPFPAAQLPAMEAAFAKKGLGNYQFEGNRIRIPRGQQSAYVAALAEYNALPENYKDIFDNAVKSLGPFTDPKQREQAIKGGKQKQLEMIIEKMSGVQKAYVMYDTEIRRGFHRDNITTASVNVTTAGLEALPESHVQAIRTLVSKAVAGLTPENVAVTDLRTGRTFAGSGDSMTSALDDPYGSRKKMYEQQWKEKILVALSYVQGVTVAPNVELDRDRSRHTETTQYDPKSPPIQTTERSKTQNTESSPPGGRPGFPAQQPNMSLSLGGGKNSKDEREETENTAVYQLAGTRERIEGVGLTPKRVTVAIGIPTSRFVKIWRERNPANAAKTPDAAGLDPIRSEEITKIRDHVAKLLPPVEGVSDPTQLVQVTSFDDLPAPEVAPPTMGNQALGWLAENWTTVGMILLGMIALMMVRSLLRSLPAVAATGAPAAVAATPHAENEEEDDELGDKAAAAAHRLKRFSGSGPSLRDELAELVSEDPDAAANVLRTWIGSVTSKT